MYVIYKCAVLHKGLEHPRGIHRGPGTNHPWIQKDDYIWLVLLLLVINCPLSQSSSRIHET